MKHAIVFALLIASGAAMSSPPEAMADVNLDIAIGAPPPPPTAEVIPPPRAGYVWVPGYWDWNGSSYIWIGGDWEGEREGFVYERPAWRHFPDGWHLYRGGWREDPVHRIEPRQPERPLMERRGFERGFDPHNRR